MVKREVESVWCENCGHERLSHVYLGCEAGYGGSCGCRDFQPKMVKVSTFEVVEEADDDCECGRCR